MCLTHGFGKIDQFCGNLDSLDAPVLVFANGKLGGGLYVEMPDGFWEFQRSDGKSPEFGGSPKRYTNEEQRLWADAGLASIVMRPLLKGGSGECFQAPPIVKEQPRCNADC